MANYCKYCGAHLSGQEKFCAGCGKPLGVPDTVAVREPEKPQAPSPADAPAAKAAKPEKPQKPEGFLKSFFREFADLFRHPKKLIPTIVLSVVWMVFSILSAAGKNVPFLRFLYAITYSNGGMFGGFFGTLGGIFGKAVFAGVINVLVLKLCAKENPFKGLRGGFRGIFRGGLDAVLPFILGGGIGLTLYCFFNVTSSPVNCAVAVVSAVGVISAISRKNGLLFSAVFSLMKKLTKGKSPSSVDVTRVLSGFSAGFALGLPLTFLRLPWLNLILGLLMIVVPLIVRMIRKIQSKKTPGNKAASAVASVLLLAILGSAAFSAFAVEFDDSYCERTFKGEDLWCSELSSNSFYGRKYDSAAGIYRYDWVHQVWDKGHKQLYYQEKYDVTVTMKAILVNNGEWLDSMSYSARVADYSTDFLYTFYQTADDVEVPDGYSRMFLKVDGYDAVYIYTEKKTEGGNGISPWAENKGTIYVPIVGAPNQEGEINTLLIRCSLDGESHALFDAMREDYLNFLQNLPCQIEVQRKEKVFKKGADLPENTGKTDPGKETDEDGEDKPTPFRGRLTYKNGKKNKYGQPFPDLVDFDGDGAITWLDYDIQRELSHDPDWLDRPERKGVGILLAILTGLLGAGGGAAAGALSGIAAAGGSTLTSVVTASGAEAAAGAGADVFAGNPYVSRDSDGDLHVTDPATGEKRLYRANGDGTYTNPLTDATYTEQELNDSLASREENADLIRQDANAAKEALEDQRGENQGKSLLTQELEAQKAAEEAALAQQEKHDQYVSKLGEKHGILSDEESLRQHISAEQGRAEVESYEQQELGAEYDKSVKYTENVKKGADVAIDVLAEIEPTGAGKVIKDEYTVLSSAASNAGEVMAGEKTVLGAITQTAVDSTVGLLKNHADDLDVTGTGGYAEKFVLNTAGDGIAATSNELMKGKSMEEARKAGSEAGTQGLVNFAVDSAFDGLGAKFGSDSGSSAGSVLGSEITKKGVTDGSKALGSDLTKNLLSPDDPDEEAASKATEAFEKQALEEEQANRDAARHFREVQEALKNERDGE